MLQRIDYVEDVVEEAFFFFAAISFGNVSFGDVSRRDLDHRRRCRNLYAAHHLLRGVKGDHPREQSKRCARKFSALLLEFHVRTARRARQDLPPQAASR